MGMRISQRASAAHLESPPFEHFIHCRDSHLVMHTECYSKQTSQLYAEDAKTGRRDSIRDNYWMIYMDEKVKAEMRSIAQWVIAQRSLSPADMMGILVDWSANRQRVMINLEIMNEFDKAHKNASREGTSR
ncbi:uncharacterized protein EAF01_010862 [Botrytis porri]|uniref:uncharacterized protein n=1 Tax=Botrytis porri TaxID=87229 RepID=UPI001900C234|nr:uncharacterized protein EAF01_010862 [Botrytis porri]KAF7889369.1 hypothetical protein EAF01_010862 [Botrytis porri]